MNVRSIRHMDIFHRGKNIFQSVIDWQTKRNGVTGLTKEHIGYENGVLGCVVSALTAFAAQGMQYCFTFRLISDSPDVLETMDLRWCTVR